MTKRFTAVLLLAALALPALAYDLPGMRDAMRSVFSSMRVLLELSASPENLAQPANERAVLGALEELSDQAALLSAHAPRDEVSFLAGALERYAGWIERSYRWGRFEASTRLVHDAVEVCIACHTRLPSRRDSPIAEDFLAGSDMESLPAPQRARLQIATRRFEDALVTLEGLLPELDDPESFADLLRTYLVVAVRVKDALQRARATLEALAAQSRGERAAWLTGLARDLAELERSPPARADLARARALLAGEPPRAPAGRPADLVDAIAASRLLYQYLEEDGGTVTQGAEAYYLLGLAEYRMQRRAWLPRAELFLEKAIRTAPASEHAWRALALLEIRVREGFAARGEPVPDDVERHLEMLGEMVPSG